MGECILQFHIYVTSALDVGEWPISQLGHFSLVYIEETTKWASGLIWTCWKTEISLAFPGIEFWSSSLLMCIICNAVNKNFDKIMWIVSLNAASLRRVFAIFILSLQWTAADLSPFLLNCWVFPWRRTTEGQQFWAVCRIALMSSHRTKVGIYKFKL